MDDQFLFEVLFAACEAVGKALGELADWGPAGTRPGQYRLDLVADAAAVDVLHRGGLAVLSEESGRSGEGPLLAVLDPVDGSTNADRGIPIYSTSICVLDDDGPLLAVVVNQATGVRYEARRGAGAGRDGMPIAPSKCEQLSSAIVGLSGYPERHLGWGQYRALGAASLELCAVAEGVLDAYLPVGTSVLSGWDYLGGLLICQEAGAVVADLHAAELIVRDATPRSPVGAATPRLLQELLAAAG
jgi:myo-inositol-1(or 4)-monophosphatase